MANVWYVNTYMQIQNWKTNIVLNSYNTKGLHVNCDMDAF
jgi:hypothetical protein